MINCFIYKEKDVFYFRLLDDCGNMSIKSLYPKRLNDMTDTLISFGTIIIKDGQGKEYNEWLLLEDETYTFKYKKHANIDIRQNPSGLTELHFQKFIWKIWKEQFEEKNKE